jgi:hypothetical protein
MTQPTPPPPDPGPATPRRVRLPALALILVLALLILHTVQSVRLFPSLAALVDPQAPVLVVDHALHLDHGILVAGFLRSHRAFWGYDPAFMAGYPVTPVWDSSSNLATLFQALAGASTSPRPYKLGLLACSVLLLPILVLAAAGCVGRRPAEILPAAGLAWLYVWAGFPLSLWQSGLFAFITSAALVTLLLGLLVRYDRQPSLRLAVAIGAVGTVAFFAHVTAPIMASGGLLGYLLATSRRPGLARRFAPLVAAALATVVLNLPWLVPLARFRGLRTGTGFFLTSNSVSFFPNFLVHDPLDGRLTLLILALGTLGARPRPPSALPQSCSWPSPRPAASGLRRGSSSPCVSASPWRSCSRRPPARLSPGSPHPPRGGSVRSLQWSP